MNRKKLILPSLDNRLEKFKSPFRPPIGAMPTTNDIYFPGAGKIGKDYEKFMKGRRPRIPVIIKVASELPKVLTCPHCGKHIDIKITLKKG